jgi:hypothetical protein
MTKGNKSSSSIRWTCCALLLCSLAAAALADAALINPPLTDRTAASDTIAFTNVTVVPMDRDRLLANQTVVVRGGRIAEVGAADEVALSGGAIQIDGTGKYLMPGLIACVAKKK